MAEAIHSVTAEGRPSEPDQTRAAPLEAVARTIQLIGAADGIEE